MFLKVVETGSFAGAGRLLGLTQPAISQLIGRLEEIYGGDLFERRRGAPLHLTPIGEAILPSARTILDTVDRQMTRAAEAAQGRVGVLALGINTGLTVGPLRTGLASFIAASPDVSLRVVEGSAGELYRQLTNRKVDIIVAEALPDLQGGSYVQERLWEEQLVVALPATNRLAGKVALTWAEIASMPLVVSLSRVEATATRMLLRRAGVQPILFDQHEGSLAMLLDLVGIGIGATIVPESAALPHPGIAFRPIADTGALVAIEAIWPRDDRNPLRHRLLDHIRRARDGASQPSTTAAAKAPGPDRG